jgi:hypothetical protein
LKTISRNSSKLSSCSRDKRCFLKIL